MPRGKRVELPGTVAREVEEYLGRVPEPCRQALEDLRRIIRAAVPDASEVISYQIPTFRYHGPLVAYAAWKKHLSLYPMSGALVEEYAAELTGFVTSTGTIQFTVEHPLPEDLVRKLVAARVEANLAKSP